MSRKSMSFLQLIDYISREGKAEGVPVFQNFVMADPDDLLRLNRAFVRNARHCPKRKNGVILYHEILSLSPDDKEYATPEILADLAERYLALRAPQAMAWGRVHFDRNPHVHLVISANLKNQSKKLRLSKTEFAQVKRDLEAYQRARYPELSRSVVFDEAENGKQKGRGSGKENEPESGREVKEKTEPVMPSRTPPEQARAKRLREQEKSRGARSTKEALRYKLLDALAASLTLSAFEQRLHENDIVLYRRNGRPAGIVSGSKKYRFTTLGLDEAFRTAQARWERLPERRRSLGDLFAEKTRRFFREFGFARDLMAVLGRGNGEGIRQRSNPRRHSRSPGGLDRER